MKVTLNNFQILEGQNTLEFIEGVNVLVGPNASGKSSIFYAIENALTNPNGVDDCINYNHNFTSVTIENNDNCLTWLRKVGSSTYINDRTGDKYVKASKLDSRDVCNLGFYFDLKNRVINIHNEWSVLFPFGESDTDMFRLFEDIFNISSSFQIIDEMKRDEQYIKSSLTGAQNEKSNISDKLNTLYNITDNVSLDSINEMIESINSCSLRTSELQEDYITFSKSYLYKNITLPDVYDVSLLYERYHNYQSIENDFLTYEQLRKKADIRLPKIDLNITIPVFDSELKNDYEQYCITKANMIALHEELNEVSQEKDKIQENINQIKVCPTCGNILEE